MKGQKSILWTLTSRSFRRSRKRTALAICSLTLGLVLTGFVCAQNAGLDAGRRLLDMAAAGTDVVSRRTMAETRSAAGLGYAVSAAGVLAGILNFANSTAASILSRKRELAVIRSAGMTKCQLRGMLILEGLYCAGLTLAASCLCAAAVGAVVRSMAGDGFSLFRFTLLPAAVCAPGLLLSAVLIPCVCFHKLEKQSIVERLRAAD